ncbi:HAD family hydrolase [bacterium]|nr:HAD family hydrolase [bacterium]
MTVVFDLDGTLVDSLQDICLALNAAAQVYQIPPIERSQVLSWIGGGVESLLASARGDSPVDPVGFREAYGRAYHAQGHSHSPLYPGVKAGLRRLQQASVPMAILTNKPEHSARHLVEALGIEGFFQVVAGPDTYGAHKPNPQGLSCLMQVMGATPLTTRMIGDSESDVLAGQAAGTMTVAVTYGYRASRDLQALNPTAVCHTFSEVVAWVLDR